MDDLLSLATTLQIVDENERVPDDLPILGNNAYRLPLKFCQQANRHMDLPPEAIGGPSRCDLKPVASDLIRAEERSAGPWLSRHVHESLMFMDCEHE